MQNKVENTQQKTILLIALTHKLLAKKWKIAATGLCAVIVTYLLILPVPRYYTCDVSLAPETNDELNKGGLSSLASSFGLNANGSGEDAISPELYPDLFESNDFIMGLLDIQVTTKDGKIHTDYYDYLSKYQKYNVLMTPVYAIIRMLKKPEKPHAAESINPFMLSKHDDEIFKGIKGSITCDVDKKTDVITITVTDQDPLVAATLADSVREHLQDFITVYRTKKARVDVIHYTKLVSQTLAEYNKALAQYSTFCDAHEDAILQVYVSQRDKLEQNMQMKYEAYHTMCSQLEAMKAKLQERTPAFTTLKSASVPVKPAGPKRLIDSIVVGFLVTIFYMLYLIRHDIKNILLQ